MKGDPPMTQEIIVWSLLIGLIGLTWVVVLAILSDDHPTQDRQNGSASSERSDGSEPRGSSPQQSRAAA